MLPEQQEVEDFSLATGGLIYTIFARIRFGRPIVRALILTALAWIPLFVLSTMNDLAVGKAVKIPFLADYGVYGRILVAIPFLLLANIPIGIRTRDVLRQFTTPKLVLDQDMPYVLSAVNEALKQKNSFLIDVIIIFFIYSFTGVRSGVMLLNSTSTWYFSGGSISPPGWYYAFVSLPIFQFLLVRWIWRLAVWTGLLWKISRLNLQLTAIHPDRMGGLGFLGLAQIPFSVVAFAGGAVISSSLINQMIYKGYSLSSATGVMVAYIIISVLVFIAPLIVFTDKMVATRANGILKLGNFGEDYATSFEDKWIKGHNPQNEEALGTSDIQSLADLANSYNIVQDMGITAVDRKTALVIAVMAAIPMIPVFFVALPFNEIVLKLLGVFR